MGSFGRGGSDVSTGGNECCDHEAVGSRALRVFGTCRAVQGGQVLSAAGCNVGSTGIHATLICPRAATARSRDPRPQPSPGG